MPLDNGRIASLLAREGASARGHLALALKRASRSALLWPDEAADLIAAGRPLTELQGIGPNLVYRHHRPYQRLEDRPGAG
jgi:hypothetical protein